MMGWDDLVIALVMMIVSYAIQASNAPKNTQKDAQAGQLDTPKVEEGEPIPVVFGTVLCKQAQVVWYGNASTQPIWSQGGGKK